MIKNCTPEELAKLVGKVPDRREALATLPPKEEGEKEKEKETGRSESTKGFIETANNEEIVDFLSAPSSEEYKPLAFEDPVELLYFIDDDLASGKRKLWDWQLETLLFIWKDQYDIMDRLKFCLTAANGSGKDAYIIAPLAVTQLVTKVRSRFIGTSKSSHQLNTQTNGYIRNLTQRLGGKLRTMNFHQKPFLFHTKPFHIACSFTGAEILTFVTDEAGNVEGYHPWPDAPNAWITIAINEAKGVPDEFFDGFSRCTYSRWIEVTSPGLKTGRNFEHYDKSVKHSDKYEKGKFYSRRITSYQCPHKSIKVIEEDAEDFGGKDSPLFRSKHLAEYTDVGESVLLSFDVYDKWIKLPPLWDNDGSMAAGLDLSLGGDETVLITRRGNKLVDIEGTRIKDATLLETYLDKLFYNKGLTKKDPIFTDVGGLGKPIAQTLIKMGWRIVQVLNNNPAIGFDKHIYANRGTEQYFEVCNYISRGYIQLKPDKLLREQLCSRKYIRMDSDKMKMQPKRQIVADKDRQLLSSAQEWVSPDRADALVLAFCEFEPIELKKKKEARKDGNLRRVSQAEMIKELNEDRFKGFNIGKNLEVRTNTSRQNMFLKHELEQYNQKFK
jgi:hypothetical protein